MPPGPIVRGSELADDFREAAGPGGMSGRPQAASLRFIAIGGESQHGTLRQFRTTALAERYLSAASSSCAIQPRQLVTVFNAVRMSAATDAAEIDLNFGPPIL